jgi:cell volume regulation protein A
VLTLEVAPRSFADGRKVFELKWPRETLILVLYRGDEFFVPNGATVLAARDRLIVLTSKATVENLQQGVTAGAELTAR